MEDEDYMSIAISLAKQGSGYTNPNPLVGAVIVKNNKIIGTGYHKCYGSNHAEINAMNDANESLDKATMYVTLEPCAHYGKTPPCAITIAKSGISKVVIGSRDPNPLVNGQGIKILKDAGIEVVLDVLKEECLKLNEVFYHFIKTKTPFVTMKYAMTLDGKITTATKKSKWITNNKAREYVHLLRHQYTAIMVGVNTIIMDNPQLTSRIPNSKNPIRIICDTTLRTPLDSNVVTSASLYQTIIATCISNQDKISKYTKLGCKVITVKAKANHLDLNDLMIKLGQLNIDSILLEGGGQLNWSALENNIVNKVICFIAPVIFGGTTSLTPVGGKGIDLVLNSIKLSKPKVTYFDDSIMLESQVL